MFLSSTWPYRVILVSSYVTIFNDKFILMISFLIKIISVASLLHFYAHQNSPIFTLLEVFFSSCKREFVIKVIFNQTLP